MSVLHRIDDMWSIPADRFYRLAERLAAYPGVMQARALAEQEKERTNPTPVPLAVHDPAISGLIEHSTVPQRR